MLPFEQPDRIQIAFDDHRLVANAGLLLPVTLAQRLGLSQRLTATLTWAALLAEPTRHKMTTLVASALAGGDCIDDADALRAGGVGRVLGCVVKAPSTLGTFLRSFRWGHVPSWIGWPGAAGPGLGYWSGTGRRTVDQPGLTVCEPLGCARRVRNATTTPASGAITRSWPWPPEPATC